MGDHFPVVRVGVVQAASAFLNRERSLEIALHWIREAGRQNVQVVAFPEGFIPAHPIWYHFHPCTGKQSLDWAAQLFANSVVVGGPETDALCEAAREAKTYVVIGICEKMAGTTGTMFNTQLFIDNQGRILGKHQKLMPTVGERMVHAPGQGDLFQVYETPFGRLSGLLCGENANPLAAFTLAAQGTQIHVASWPNHFSMNEHGMVDAITFNTLSFSYKCSCFVLNACGVISDEIRELLPYREEDKAFLHKASNGGGSSIIGATSQILAGPMPGDQEGLLIADIDLMDCVRAKIVHDYAGHYNRPDIFTLTVRTAATPIMQKVPVTVPVQESRAGELPIAEGDEGL